MAARDEYQKAQSKVDLITADIRRQTKLADEAEKRASNVGASLSPLKEKRERALVARDEIEAREAEEAIEKCEKSADRDKVLASGVRTKVLPDLDAQLAAAMARLSNVLWQLTADFIDDEKRRYERAAGEAKASLRRIYAAYHHAKEIDRRRQFEENIGPSFEYLRLARVPSILTFRKEVFLSNTDPGIRPTQGDLDGVFAEIIKKGG